MTRKQREALTLFLLTHNFKMEMSEVEFKRILSCNHPDPNMNLRYDENEDLLQLFENIAQVIP